MTQPLVTGTEAAAGNEPILPRSFDPFSQDHVPADVSMPCL